LTADEKDALYERNYTQAHRACLPAWSDLERVCKQVETLLRSGRWKGDALERMLSDLRTASAPANNA
jgi:hypothetical protein